MQNTFFAGSDHDAKSASNQFAFWYLLEENKNKKKLFILFVLVILIEYITNNAINYTYRSFQYSLLLA